MSREALRFAYVFFFLDLFLFFVLHAMERQTGLYYAMAMVEPSMNGGCRESEAKEFSRG